MDRYATKTWHLVKTTNIKINRKTLGVKQPTGAMPKRQAQGVELSALRLFQNKENGKMICGEMSSKRGFETVLDNGYSGESKTCLLCGGSVCKVNFLKIPFESLIRFKSENYTCARVINIFNEVKKEFQTNESIKINIANLRASLTILKQNNRFILACFEMSKLKILSEIFSLEKQSEFIISRFIDNKIRENDSSYTEKRYNKIQNSIVFIVKC